MFPGLNFTDLPLPAESDAERANSPLAGLAFGQGFVGPAFAIDEPVSVMSPVVFASPHSGRHYPKAFLEGCKAQLIDLRRIEDAYVDRLLSDVTQSGAPMIAGLVGRACIDMNRAIDEIDPAMFSDPDPAWGRTRSARVDAGLGCIPRVAHGGQPVYARKLSRSEAETRIAEVWQPYHRALGALLRRAHAMFGAAWLVDVHSMPNEAEPSSRMPDIVIGDRFGASCSGEVVSLVESLFRQRGYTTARNAPYAGGYATHTYGQPHDGRHALQIEIRRRLYLDEDRVEPREGFLKLRQHLTEIATEMALHTRRTVGLSSSGTRRRA